VPAVPALALAAFVTRSGVGRPLMLVLVVDGLSDDALVDWAFASFVPGFHE